MPLFRRRRAGESPFLADVRGALDALGLRYEIGDGLVTFEGSALQAGLANLEQMWTQAEPGDRRELVAEHFRGLLAAEARDSESLPGDDALPLARVRIWAREDVPADFPLIARPLADDLLAAVVLDLPESVTSVKPEQADAWGVDQDELFERAAAQTRADPDLEVERFEVDRGATVTWAESGSFFAASRVLWPEDLLGAPAGEHGALLAVPNRHLVGAHAIEDLRVVAVVQTMLGFAARRYEAGPGSISPHLYWWRPEGLLRLPGEVDEEAIRFFPPDEFVALLNGLSEPDR